MTCNWQLVSLVRFGPCLSPAAALRRAARGSDAAASVEQHAAQGQPRAPPGESQPPALAAAPWGWRPAAQPQRRQVVARPAAQPCVALQPAAPEGRPEPQRTPGGSQRPTT